MPNAYATPIWKIARGKFSVWTQHGQEISEEGVHDSDSPAIFPRTNAAVDPTPNGQPTGQLHWRQGAKLSEHLTGKCIDEHSSLPNRQMSERMDTVTLKAILTNSATHSTNQWADLCLCLSHWARIPGRAATSARWTKLGRGKGWLADIMEAREFERRLRRTESKDNQGHLTRGSTSRGDPRSYSK